MITLLERLRHLAREADETDNGLKRNALHRVIAKEILKNQVGNGKVGMGPVDLDAEMARRHGWSVAPRDAGVRIDAANGNGLDCWNRRPDPRRR